MDELIAALSFPEEGHRQDQLSNASRGTYNWLLDSTEAVGRNVRTASESFATFLSGPPALFWVTGKPGAGKSTLLKFLSDHEDKIEQRMNNASHGDKVLVLPAFFFWRLGSPLQKSLGGMLRSLVRQVLESRARGEPGFTLAMDGVRGPPGSWAVEDLQKVLCSLVEDTRYNYFFVVDGLDEFDGPASAQTRLTDLLVSLAARPNIKVCCSSRHEAAFADAFASYPTFAMQDLTSYDTYVAVRDMLHDNPVWKQYRIEDDQGTKHLVARIRDKAEGVFLWARLATEDILRGLKKHDSLELLEERLEQMHPDMDAFMLSLLDRIDAVYLPSVKHVLRMRLCPEACGQKAAVDGVSQTTLLATALLMDPQPILDAFAQEAREPSPNASHKPFDVLNRRFASLKDQFAGLLDTSKGPPAPIKYERVVKGDTFRGVLSRQSAIHHGVPFIHRSVAEFFYRDPQARAWLQLDSLSWADCAKGWITVVKQELEIMWSITAEISSALEERRGLIQAAIAAKNPSEYMRTVKLLQSPVHLMNEVLDQGLHQNIQNILTLVAASAEPNTADAVACTEVQDAFRRGRAAFSAMNRRLHLEVPGYYGIGEEMSPEAKQSLVRLHSSVSLRQLHGILSLSHGDMANTFSDFARALALVNCDWAHTSERNIAKLAAALATGVSLEDCLYGSEARLHHREVRVTQYSLTLIRSLVQLMGAYATSPTAATEDGVLRTKEALVTFLAYDRASVANHFEVRRHWPEDKARLIEYDNKRAQRVFMAASIPTGKSLKTLMARYLRLPPAEEELSLLNAQLKLSVWTCKRRGHSVQDESTDAAGDDSSGPTESNRSFKMTKPTQGCDMAARHRFEDLVFAAFMQTGLEDEDHWIEAVREIVCELWDTGELEVFEEQF